jgi:xylan 1,4-beta-xylosidase
MTPRPFEEGAVTYGEDGFGRFFAIKGSKYPLSSVNARNIVLTRQKDFVNTYSATMVIPDLQDEQCAGICGYYDENTHVLFGLKNKAGKLFIFVKEHIGDTDRRKEEEIALLPNIKMIRLTMKTDHLDRRFYYSLLAENAKVKVKDTEDAVLMADLPNVYYLCDEGYDKGKRFTGALLGMFAFAGEEKDLCTTFYDSSYSYGDDEKGIKDY